MRTEITLGQLSGYLGFKLVMAEDLPEPKVLQVDRGYDADGIRKSMDDRGIRPVMPLSAAKPPAGQCMRRPRKKNASVCIALFIGLDKLVGRYFNKLKKARRVATRYDKSAGSFLGFIDIASIRLWLSHSSHDSVCLFMIRSLRKIEQVSRINFN